MVSDNPATDSMKTAHVLFMDIVGYSSLPIDEQTSALHILQEIVRGTAQVARAQAANQLTSIPTGDGMALVFFSEPTAPVECALEVGKALKAHPEIQLRMGVHSGPVNQIIDVNERTNVAGAGINMAQRVMDSGDAGHILVSKRVAEDLSQYSRWRPMLRDLDEVEVKHAVRVHLFNLVTDDVGNPVLPEAVKKRKKRTIAPLIAAAALVAVMIPIGVILINKNRGGPTARPVRPETESRAVLQRKTDIWLDTIFNAQASGGGIKMSASSGEATTQVWQTAQCLVAALSSPKNLDSYVPRIKNAFKYLESLHRPEPASGWNLYGNANQYTITEIGSWVTLANIKSLDAKTAIWSDSERTQVLSNVLRNLEEISRRQDSGGGWRPIKDDNAEFTRTYPTVMALWSLIEARKSPSVSPQIGTKYDESMRRGINWLLGRYKDGQGWVPNPNRVGQKGRFDGLTAHALFVLSRAETADALGFIKSDQTYGRAKRDFIKNKQFTGWSIEENNSHMPDADLRFVNTEFQAEGSTFLWFPWTLVELAQLSSDPLLSEDERKAAAQLRLEILNANFDKLENYVESANLMYVLGENLFCVSAYLERTAE
jgi:class 3 adenylate cyclase